MPDMAGSGFHVQTSLRGIAKTASTNRHHRFRNLYGLMNPALLRHAWDLLDKSKAIADTDITVADYQTDLWSNLANLSSRLREKRYRAKHVSRKYIPKENGKQRPLGIPALEDKIVQKAASLILESIFDGEFLPCSYGYRRGVGAKLCKWQFEGCMGILQADP